LREGCPLRKEKVFKYEKLLGHSSGGKKESLREFSKRTNRVHFKLGVVVGGAPSGKFDKKEPTSLGRARWAKPPAWHLYR